jgi:hypothetical protein
MSKQAQDILDAIKNDPTNWNYHNGRIRRADGVLSIYVRAALLFPTVKVEGADPHRAWHVNEYELPATLRQRHQFRKLDLWAGIAEQKRLREEQAARDLAAIQQLIDRRPPIEINPVAAQQAPMPGMWGIQNADVNHPILQAAMGFRAAQDLNIQEAARPQGQQVVI